MLFIPAALADWWNTFGEVSEDVAYSIQQTTDGGYIIAGWTENGANHEDAYLIKTDANSTKLWEKTFGGSDEDYAYSVQQTTDGGYIVAGFTSSYGAGSRDAWLIKTDVDGNKLWDKTFGGPYRDYAYSVQQTTDGGYIIAGSAALYEGLNDDAWLVKTDASGNKL
jgi:hypothetical protein